VELGHFRDLARGGGKRARTRAALLDAAILVVAEKGMEALKISDITSAAEMANGTFYNHFNDKDEVLREAAYGIAFEISRQLDDDMKDIVDAPTRVVTATNSFIEIILHKPEWASLMLASGTYLPQLRADVSQFLRADLERGVAQEKFEVDVSDFLLQQIISLVTVAITTQLEIGRNKALNIEVCEYIMRLLGFSPAKARKIVAATI
jgi:AcrR family transcriptional regulator